MSVEVAKPLGRRAESKHRRRLQLIRATIKCIAATGLSGVTMATVTREAGLSLGLANLHFESKEKLLVETLRYVADEYQSTMYGVWVDESLSAAEKLRGIVDADFSPRLCERGRLSVWFAYWGETRARPIYRRICAAADRECDQALTDICLRLADQSGLSEEDAARTVVTYSALSNGLWLDLLVNPGQMSRRRAHATCLTYLASVFGPAFPSDVDSVEERR